MTSLINGIKGILIGIALVIPGLSGSIFAVVVGLYDKLLLAVSNLRKEPKKSILFLLPIAIGCVAGILLSTKAVLYLCETFRLQSYSFFIGLVLGSMPLVLKKLQKENVNWRGIIIAVVSFAVIVYVGSLTGTDDGMPAKMTAITSVFDFMDLFLTGMMICALMMVPGVSGSVLLMLVGKYETIYNAVGCAGDMLRAMLAGNSDLAYTLFLNILVVLPFLLGALVGLALVAKLLTFLLKRFEVLVYYGVLGLVSGAAVSLFVGSVMPSVVKLPGGGVNWMMTAVWFIVFVVIGYFCTTLLDVKPTKKEADDTADKSEETA